MSEGLHQAHSCPYCGPGTDPDNPRCLGVGSGAEQYEELNERLNGDDTHLASRIMERVRR